MMAMVNSGYNTTKIFFIVLSSTTESLTWEFTRVLWVLVTQHQVAANS